MLKSLLLFSLLFSSSAFAALSAATTWEVQSLSTAANANGCGFVTGATGTDWSQATSAKYTGTDLLSSTGTTAPCTVSTTSSHSFIATDVGNLIHITAGTSWLPAWYQIVSVAAGVATLDRACGSVASISSGTYSIGGACSLNSSTANQTDTNWAAAVIAGNTVYIKNDAAYTFAAAPTFGAGSSGTVKVKIIGYNSSRGDNPTLSNRPSINAGTFTVNFGGFTQVSNLIVTGTASPVFKFAAWGFGNNLKCTNTSTTASRACINFSDDGGSLYNSESVSYRGTAVSTQSSNQFASHNIFYNYLHDSNIGLAAGAEGVSVVGNLIASNVTDAITVASSSDSNYFIAQNTLYGLESKKGVGIAISSEPNNLSIINNIVYGFVTGISDAGGANAFNFGDYNDFNNNTTNFSTWTDGAHSITTSPAFTNVAQYTGTTATTTGSVLTDSGANYTDIVAGRDYLYVSATTGGTVGIYGITTSTSTTITTDIALGSGTAVTYFVTHGRNWTVGTNVKAVGFPGLFNGLSATQGYTDIGAVQRQDPGGAGSGYSRGRVINR
jgi:hypothetical protein